MNGLEHLALIWLAVLLSSYCATKTRLTPVLFLLFFGALMINTGILPKEPSAFIDGLADIGIILIMFAVGFEENTRHFVASIKRSWGIAFFGGLIPFLVAFNIADIFWDDLGLSLMCGLAMTATAVSLTLVSLREEGLNRTEAATGIMTSAVLDDIASLALVAIIVPVAAGEAHITAEGISLVILKAVGFFVSVSFISLAMFPRGPTGKFFEALPFPGKFGVRSLFVFAEGRQATLVLMIIAALVGLLANWLGFHPAVGAYMAGLILKEDYFRCPDEEENRTYQQVKMIIENVAFVWLGPIFFVQLGAKLQFDADILVSVIPQTVLMSTGLIIGQVASAGLAARFTGHFPGPDSLLIGLGMLGRAELAFLVMDIGYVQHQIFTTEVFYTLMGTAFCMNVAVPLAIRGWKLRYKTLEPG